MLYNLDSNYRSEGPFSVTRFQLTSVTKPEYDYGICMETHSLVGSRYRKDVPLGNFASSSTNVNGALHFDDLVAGGPSIPNNWTPARFT